MTTAMTLSEILEELLGQHATLRGLAQEVCGLAARPASAEARAELSRLLGTLAEEVAAHVLREEELLGEVLPTVDAWGPVRAAKMSRPHREEHRRLAEAVASAAGAPDLSAALGAALPAIEALLEHMREEEAEHLNANVLRDDVVVIDQFDG